MQNESNKRMNFTKIFAGSNRKFYTNSETKEFFYKSEILGEPILIEMLPTKWRLTQQTKKNR
ncbi:MAG: hypothetical protein GKR88_13375 [Flavobacteriaceae bacterium]|nr:MAG: hypothetical protein GKR88_13375 [Flavobacteriaceae bacterium]